MKRLGWLIILALAAEGSLLAQEPPKDVKRSVDTFTGDTTWETKYGRLDDSHGCSRSDLGIVWKLRRGPTGRSEWLTYTVYHGGLRASVIDSVQAALNVDGRIIEGRWRPSPKPGASLGGALKDALTGAGNPIRAV